MTFSILAIRTAEDEDGSLYPLVGDASSIIELEEADGGAPAWMTASSIKVFDFSQKPRKLLLGAEEISAQLGYTKSRFLVGCEKWIKGGGWYGFGVGGLAVAVVANSVSKARAARRRKGKVLLGQVRFEWIRSIGFRSRRGMLHPALARVVIKVVDGDFESLYMFEAEMNKRADVDAWGSAFAAEVARHRLTNASGLTSDERASLEEIVRGSITLNYAKDSLSSVSFPGAAVVSE